MNLIDTIKSNLQLKYIDERFFLFRFRPHQLHYALVKKEQKIIQLSFILGWLPSFKHFNFVSRKYNIIYIILYVSFHRGTKTKNQTVKLFCLSPLHSITAFRVNQIPYSLCLSFNLDRGSISDPTSQNIITAVDRCSRTTIGPSWEGVFGCKFLRHMEIPCVASEFTGISTVIIYHLTAQPNAPLQFIFHFLSLFLIGKKIIHFQSNFYFFLSIKFIFYLIPKF